MCRNIKTLFNFDPPATTDEVKASAIQFVRKLSGFSKPSREAFELAVERISAAAQEMLNSYVTSAPPRDRETEGWLRQDQHGDLAYAQPENIISGVKWIK